MKSLLSGEVFSYRHQLHSKESLEPEEKSVLKNISFGPIEDEEQVSKMMQLGFVLISKQTDIAVQVQVFKMLLNLSCCLL